MLLEIWLPAFALFDLSKNWKNTTVPVFGLLRLLYSRTVIMVSPMESKKKKH